ncbi:phasin family protein [Halothermothrix orenii]|uniref:Uncharacterized conserved protein n=1 Tax=Halothermothrix orenii (strain H 168 / OCM 544 / DSM 9562) TaxID=373903 RepID=B8CXF5_HALOH|nr:phasin family protein [Halothermothrix orenii]ACL69974.1 uncharacterized conserved protein [Halothermothrix orenii H 168]
MTSILKEILLSGLGILVITKEKAEKMINKLIEQGDLSREEGRELLDEFIDKTRERTRNLKNLISEEVENKLSRAGFVTRSELKELENEILKLKQELKELKNKGD